MSHWIYSHDQKKNTRYALGVMGTKPLIIFGVNPSVAEPEYLGKSDPTIEKVKRLSKNLGFDSWIMLNLYPQIATNPNDLDLSIDSSIHKKNLLEIKKILNTYSNAVVVAAWGNLIQKRTYLETVKKDIYHIMDSLQRVWHCFDINKSGHPKHPLYVNERTLVLQEYKY